MSKINKMACRFPDNGTLSRYFEEHVLVKTEKTTRIREQILPKLYAILDYVHNQDKRFGKKGVRVGSSTQGLNVDIRSDVDVSVLFNINPDESEDHWSLSWGDDDTKPRFYDFKDQTEHDTSSLSYREEIVKTPRPLPTPRKGYHFLGGFSLDKKCSSGLQNFLYEEDLIPFLVMRKLKRLLLEASEKLQLKGKLVL